MNTRSIHRAAGVLVLTGALLMPGRAATAWTLPAYVEYGPIYNPANEHIYFVLKPTDYHTAVRQATEMGGYPVKINNADENRWVDYTFAGFVGARIGATDTYSEGTWVTYDGQTLPYSDWASGEPNNSGFAEHCAQFYSGPGSHWNDGRCNTSAYAIVEAEDCRQHGGLWSDG